MLFTNSLKRTSGWPIASLLGLVMLVPAGASAEPITIRVVDGRNGHQVSDEKLQLWFNNQRGSAMSISADKQGIAKADAPAGASLRLSANRYVDCRYSKQTGRSGLPTQSRTSCGQVCWLRILAGS
jgi:hypothetical protein